jgi:hypothetical protein
VSAPQVGAQTPAASSAQGTTAKPAAKQAAQTTAAKSPQAFKVYELMPMTCAQAWAASGKDYAQLYRMVAALATVSLANRDLTFPNTKEAGMDAGKGIADDCMADPDGLLYAIVDKQVRRVAAKGDPR